MKHTAAMLAFLIAAACALLPAAAPAGDDLHLPLRLLYASDSSPAYSAGWMDFLAQHVKEVRAVAPSELTPELVRAWDVLVIDGELMAGSEYRLDPKDVHLPLRLSDLQGHPVLLVGGVGGAVSTRWRLAGSWGLWGCHCLKPWLVLPAPAERPALFSAPFPIEFEPERRTAPASYAEHDPGGPTELDAVRIFHSDAGEPGYVTRGDFRELPDAEWIASGINSKSAGHAAVLRHGSFVLWGFHGQAADLTDAGARLYLNALACAHAHAGAKVENLRLSAPREEVLANFQRLAPQIPTAELASHLDWLLATGFPDGVIQDPATAPAWFASVRGHLRGLDAGLGYEEDRDCAALGADNDSPEFLDELAQRLRQDPADALARTLLGRYVPAAPPDQPAEWLSAHSGQLFFTDVGGFVWKLRGEPADALHPLRVEGLAAGCPVSVRASANEEEAVIELELRVGWHVATRAEGAVAALAVTAAPESVYVIKEAALPAGDTGRLSGRATLRVPIERSYKGQGLVLRLTFQACDRDSCRPVETARIGR